jgi:hypothetical protein
MVTALWAFVLLDRPPSWLPWLRWVIVIAGVLAAGLLVAAPRLAVLVRSRRARTALVLAPVGLALVAGLAGPAAYSVDTINTAHSGAIPTAGPQTTGFGGGTGRAGAGAAGGGDILISRWC